jgi:hypothetical protein
MEAQGHYNVRPDANASAAESIGVKVSHSGKKTTLSHTGNAPGHHAVNKDRTTINQLDSQKAQRNQFALRVRKSDQEIMRIDAQISNMKKELRVIVKNYPPFPPGSEERIARLRRFNSFRKQIEQLTIPPQQGGNSENDGLPASRSVGVEQGSLVVEAADDQGFILSVRNAGVKDVQMELRVPKLSETADDAQVHDSFKDLGEARAAIKTQRQAIMQLAAEQINSDLDDAELTTITESTAEESSYAVRRDMALITHIGFTRESTQLVGFMN